jgi:GntR family transcriptional regulator, transcriptional repressor for pyruvate dehydrogenase complex
MFDRVKPILRMPEAIARQIEEQIYLGILQTNQMLPSENELMGQFGVSRNTVREALRILESSGMVKIKQGPRGGAVITAISDSIASEFLIKAFRIGGVSPLDFYDFRKTLEPTMISLLASKESIDMGILAKMEENIAHAKQLYHAGELTAYVNMDFHVLLAEATQNMIFAVVAKTLRAAFDIVAPPEKEGFRLETILAHEQILIAIKERDAAKAYRLMKDHLDQMVEVVRLDTGELRRAVVRGT